MNEIINNIKKIKKEHIALHPEGRTIIKNVLIYTIIVNGLLYFAAINDVLYTMVNIFSVGFVGIVLYFFRNPERAVDQNENAIYAPADGKIVVVEETNEDEYFKKPRLQVSIFMSPLNVHVNRAPVSGEVKYYKYHPGNYLVAWHPKSSILNERTSVVMQANNGSEIMLRQIAGAMARRIVCYAEEGKPFNQGEDLGFIKFGSRVDIFLPLDAKLKVNIGDKVKGNRTVIAEM